MKRTLIVFSFLGSFSALASNPSGKTSIICREDNRLNSGSLRELILTPTAQGYVLQSQFVPSLNSPDLKIENWATELKCRFDEKAPLAFCQNSQGPVLTIKERRELFFDSLEVDDKRKTTKHTDITLSTGDVVQKSISFLASHCETFGGEA